MELAKSNNESAVKPLQHQNTPWKHRISTGSWKVLTIENRTSEKHQKLDEQVLLLRRKLVPAEALPPGLDVVVANALLDVGLKPVVGYRAVVFHFFFFCTAPELSGYESVSRRFCSIKVQQDLRLTFHHGFLPSPPSPPSSCLMAFGSLYVEMYFCRAVYSSVVILLLFAKRALCTWPLT